MLLKSIARILVKYGGNAVGFGVAGDAIVELWDSWNKEKQDPQEKLAEVQQLAQQSAGETRQAAADIVLELAADQPEEVRQTVTNYLTQVPAMVRRSLRRPADPTGTTIPPGVLMTKAEDLRTLLPTKVSHFKPGDYPIAGVDLELVEMLGVGGFGEVWKAWNPFQRSDPPVALKFCLDAAAAASLRHEAALLDRVKSQGTHAGIVKLLRTYLRANPPCLEYEYIEGGDLAGLIHDWHRSSTGFSPDRIARLMLQLSEIVGFAHRLNPPIVHRDLKPANILVQKAENGEPKLKVADFGIGGIAASQVIAESRSDMTRGVMAATVARGSYSPLYASRQQMAGMPADPHDDVYALGVIWYQLLIGNLMAGPPSGSRWVQRLKDQGVPQNQLDLMVQCFEDNPEDRPKDAAELAQQLTVDKCGVVSQEEEGDRKVPRRADWRQFDFSPYDLVAIGTAWANGQELGKLIPAGVPGYIFSEKLNSLGYRKGKARTNRQQFLEKCNPVVAMVSEKLLELAEAKGNSIKWGTAGFTVRTLLPKENRWVTFVEAHPERVWCKFGDLPLSADEMSSLCRELAVFGVFEAPTDKYLRVILEESKLARIEEAFKFHFDKVGEIATAH